MSRLPDPAPRRGAWEAPEAPPPPPRPLDVLMVEDSENDALLIADALRRGGYTPRWTRVESAAELRAALARSPWQAILCDWRLPGFSALDAFAICRESGPEIPFLIVSGSPDDGLAAVAARAGIRAWVSKNHLERLPRVVAELGIGQ